MPNKNNQSKHKGYGGIASVNVYTQLGSAQISRAQAAASHAAIAQSRANRDNVYATRDGQVYRHQTTGWQQRDGSGWRPTNGLPIEQLQRQQQGRITGGQRYQNFNRQNSGGIPAPPIPNGGGIKRR
jgi:hypothetical protein